MEAVRNLNDDIRRRQIWTDDGIRLSLRYFGHDRAPCVVLAHGFGQTQYAWAEIGRRLSARGWQAVSYDARGHGESDRAPSGEYDFEHFIEDFRRVCASLPNLPVVVGASMGGLTALLGHSEKPKVDVRALVLVDIAPSWDERGVEAMSAFARQHPEGFASQEDALEQLAAFLPHRRLVGNRRELSTNLRQTENGRWHWHWDPAMLALAERAGNLRTRLKSAGRRLKVPTLIVGSGQADAGGADPASEFFKQAGTIRHTTVPDNASGDQHDRFLATVTPFLQSISSQGDRD